VGVGSVFVSIFGPAFQTVATSVDYQKSDLGGAGFTILNPPGTFQVTGGTGGSGSYGIGGRGSGGDIGLGNGFAAAGNGAGGGGASSSINAPLSTGGDGSPGIWIIEEYS
jgi:hypothetical protein